MQRNSKINNKIALGRQAESFALDSHISQAIINEFIQRYGKARLIDKKSHGYKTPWYRISYIANRIIQHQSHGASDTGLSISYHELLGHALEQNKSTAHFRAAILCLLENSNSTLNSTEKKQLLKYVKKSSSQSSLFNKLGFSSDIQSKREAIAVKAEKGKNLKLKKRTANHIVDRFITNYGQSRMYIGKDGKYKKPFLMNSYIASRIMDHQSGHAIKRITFHELLGHVTGTVHSIHALRSAILEFFKDEDVSHKDKSELYAYILEMKPIFDNLLITPGYYKNWKEAYSSDKDKQDKENKEKGKEKETSSHALKRRINKSGAVQKTVKIAMQIYREEKGLQESCPGFFGVATILASFAYLDDAIASREVKKLLLEEEIISSLEETPSSEVISILKNAARKSVSGKGEGAVSIIGDANGLEAAGEHYIEKWFRN